MAIPLALGIGSVFSWVIGSWVARLVAAFGITFIVMSGLTELLEWTLDQIEAQTSGAPAQVIVALRMLKIDDAIAVLFSAMFVRLSWNTVGGVLKKMVIRGPA